MKGNGGAMATAAARLSSGLRINSAADDAAGLAISEKMWAQIRGLDQASRNAQDGSSMIQTAEGGLQQIDSMLQRVRELTIQAASDVNDESDRGKIALEINHLFEEMDSMANRVEFNDKKLLNGSLNEIHLQIGANSGQSIDFKIDNMKVSELGTGLGDLRTAVESAAASGKWNDAGSTISGFLEGIDTAIETVTNSRSKLGAIQNRLDYTMKNLDISSENLSTSMSRITDTDIAKEMMNFTRSNMLSQVSIAMLSQANQQSQNLLTLLK
jgi:flagellin